MKTIAITGGIGSGKSQVSHILRKIGYPVFDSDTCGRNALKDSSMKDQIISIFGEIPDNRSIFKDPKKLWEFTLMLLPYIQSKFEEFCREQDSNLVFIESALIYELKIEDQFDEVLLVTADALIRIDRVLKRNPNLTEEEIKNRMKQALLEDDKVKKIKNYFIIKNESSLEELELKVIEIIKTIQ